MVAFTFVPELEVFFKFFNECYYKFHLCIEVVYFACCILLFEWYICWYEADLLGFHLVCLIHSKRPKTKEYDVISNGISLLALTIDLGMLSLTPIPISISRFEYKSLILVVNIVETFSYKLLVLDNFCWFQWTRECFKMILSLLPLCCSISYILGFEMFAGG